jgi:hypothetical protein
VQVRISRPSIPHSPAEEIVQTLKSSSPKPQKRITTLKVFPFSIALRAGEQLDEWERELQHYEATLEEMATASLDMKEELGAVEQWFRVLTEAERTAALYSLLQQATQVQIRFFLTVLQQMASKTPVNHLLSPASFEKGLSPLRDYPSICMPQTTGHPSMQPLLFSEYH